MQQICPEMLPAETQELVKVTPNDNFLALIYSVLCDHKNLCPYGDTAEHVYMFKSCHIQNMNASRKDHKKIASTLRYRRACITLRTNTPQAVFTLSVVASNDQTVTPGTALLIANVFQLYKCGALRVLSDWVQLSRIYEYLRSMSLAPFEYLLVF